MIDTHTHLYMSDYDSDGSGAAAVRRAIEAGVTEMIFPNVDADSVQPMLSLAGQFPENVSYAIGLHPTEVRHDWLQTVENMMPYVDSAVAIGEVGIDLYWDTQYRQLQIEAFDHQCDIAQKHRMPLIIHCREGLDDTIDVLKNHPNLKAVFHSFGGSVHDVERIRQVGDYYFGINGIVTFKNSKLGDTLTTIGLDRLLLETDAPFLSPVPMRGKRNESAFLPYIADHIANRLGTDLNTVERATTNNARQLFKSRR